MTIQPVPFSEAARAWARVAAASFGGPAGQIAVMHRIVVEEKGWVDEERFLHALAWCMALPGPEAQQLATYLGWLLHGTRGGLLAGALFVLPGFLSILALTLLYVTWGHLPAVSGALGGLEAGVVALVIEATLRVGRRVLTSRTAVATAAGAFLAIGLFDAPFPAVVLVAATLGAARGGPGVAGPPPPPGPALRAALLWLTLWLAPIAALAAVLGQGHVLTQIATFFASAATITFGGAYGVLAWVAQRAVEDQGWLSPGEMLDGLAMAETTPGPLIQVVQFVGFLAAARSPGGLPPLVAGGAGAVITTWVTFVPSFLWIFTTAPYVEWLRGHARLRGALAQVAAAAAGAVAQLAAWFALHVAFSEVTWRAAAWGARWPALGDPRPVPIALTALSAVAVLGLRLGVLTTLGATSAAGLAWSLSR